MIVISVEITKHSLHRVYDNSSKIIINFIQQTAQNHE